MKYFILGPIIALVTFSALWFTDEEINFDKEDIGRAEIIEQMTELLKTKKPAEVIYYDLQDFPIEPYFHEVPVVNMYNGEKYEIFLGRFSVEDGAFNVLDKERHALGLLIDSMEEYQAENSDE